LDIDPLDDAGPESPEDHEQLSDFTTQLKIGEAQLVPRRVISIELRSIITTGGRSRTGSFPDIEVADGAEVDVLTQANQPLLLR
jgi:hypothetical protein